MNPNCPLGKYGVTGFSRHGAIKERVISCASSYGECGQLKAKTIRCFENFFIVLESVSSVIGGRREIGEERGSVRRERIHGDSLPHRPLLGRRAHLWFST
jgi:hypothetical protein